MNIHIVDSVKGGSGKSTFSASLCSFISQQKGKKVCVIDLDLLGTSWEQNYRGVFIEAFDEKLIHLNDLIKDFNFYKTTTFIQKIPITVFFNEHEKTQCEIEAIFCDPRTKEKNTFKITDKAYSPDISYDIFHESVIQLIELLNDLEYTDVILDMPPNSEPYSDKILNSCLKSDSVFSFSHSASLYMIANINPAHIDATFDWYDDFMRNPSSQHIVTINKIKELNKLVATDDIDEKKKSWLKNEKHKFFYVFNTMRDIKFNYKNLFPLTRKEDLYKMLAYIFIDYDAKHVDSMDSKIGLSAKVPHNEYHITKKDFNSFHLYNEIS